MITNRSDELPPDRMLISVYISFMGGRWLELPTTATVADLRSEISRFTGVDYGRHVIRCWSKLQPTNETQLLMPSSQLRSAQHQDSRDPWALQRNRLKSCTRRMLGSLTTL
jgi:hypothetical protein